MLNHILYTRRERAVYPEAMSHFLKGVLPTLMVHVFLFLITAFLYYDYMSHDLMRVFSVVLIGITLFSILLSQYLIHRGTWCRQRRSVRVGLTVIVAIFVMFAMWNVYMSYIVYYRFPNYPLVLLFTYSLGILAISAIGSFSKLLYYVIGLMSVVRLSLIVIFVPKIFYFGLMVTMADILLAVFVFLYNRKIIESIEFKVQNANLVEDLKNKNTRLENMICPRFNGQFKRLISC